MNQLWLGRKAAGSLRAAAERAENGGAPEVLRHGEPREAVARVVEVVALPRFVPQAACNKTCTDNALSPQEFPLTNARHSDADGTKSGARRRTHR